MLVEEVYLKHKPISYQYTAIDWVAVSTEVFFAIIWKHNRSSFAISILTEKEPLVVDYS